MYFCPQIEMSDLFIGVVGVFFEIFPVCDESAN